MRETGETIMGTKDFDISEQFSWPQEFQSKK